MSEKYRLVDHVIAERGFEFLGFESATPWTHQMQAGRLVCGPPSLALHRNAVFDARVFDHESAKMSGGALDAVGELIDFAQIIRGANEPVYSFNPSPTEGLEDMPESVLYGGWYFGHFGHFLVETLAWLWARSRVPPDMPVLFAAPYGLTMTETHRAILEASGVKASDIKVASKSMRISELHVPQPLFRSRQYVFEDFGAFCREIGKKIAKPIASSGAIYLSRSQTPNPTNFIANEQEAEALLSQRGVEIVFLEKMPIGQQITTINEAKVVIGPIGSAMHVALFAENHNKQMIYLCPELINGNFILSDVAAEVRSLYIKCLYPVASSSGKPAYAVDLAALTRKLPEMGL